MTLADFGRNDESLRIPDAKNRSAAPEPAVSRRIGPVRQPEGASALARKRALHNPGSNTLGPSPGDSQAGATSTRARCAAPGCA